MTQYPYPKVAELTFKDSLWTKFFLGRCHAKSPWDHAFVQAPLGVACDVLRTGYGIDPYEITCQEHLSHVGITENADFPAEYGWLLKQHGAILIVTHDAVGYYANGIWKEPRWEKLWQKHRYEEEARPQ